MTAGLCRSSRRLPALITLRGAFAADCGLPTLHINIIYICFMYTEHCCSKASLFICSASLLLSFLFGTATHTAPSRLNVAFPKQIPIRLTDNKLSYVYILSSEKKRVERESNERRLTGLPGGPAGPVSPGGPGWPYIGANIHTAYRLQLTQNCQSPISNKSNHF